MWRVWPSWRIWCAIAGLWKLYWQLQHLGLALQVCLEVLEVEVDWDDIAHAMAGTACQACQGDKTARAPVTVQEDKML